MPDFYEVDFLDVESNKSGDAIAIRYEIGGQTLIHVVDGGFQSTGESLAKHIRAQYGNPARIDHVVVTHGDGDHAGGLRTILEEFEVGTLWMIRPWLFADALIHRFSTYESVPHLKGRLKKAYPNLVALEEIAERNGVPIRMPFQGENIGAFTVASPSRDFYFDLLCASTKTPEEAEKATFADTAADFIVEALRKAVNFVTALWGDEHFPAGGTSDENEMSVVQFGVLCGHRILLTGDAGRDAMNQAADYLEGIGAALPGIDKFQVPHHGSRRNVSTEVLDRWLGPVLKHQPGEGQETFSAYCSSAKADTHHPRKAVIRAIIHRGGRFNSTEGQTIRFHKNGPDRGWGPLTPHPYPTEQESA